MPADLDALFAAWAEAEQAALKIERDFEGGRILRYDFCGLILAAHRRRRLAAAQWVKAVQLDK